ncbi:hypothetical protein BGX34_006689, partial [Mortierella sp. NVP85]
DPPQRDGNGGRDPPQGDRPPSRAPTPVPGPVERQGSGLGPDRGRAESPRRVLSCRRRAALVASAQAASVELVTQHWALSQQLLANEVDMLTVDVLPQPAVDILTKQELLQIRYKRLHSAIETEEADYNYLAGDGVAPGPPVKRTRW